MKSALAVTATVLTLSCPLFAQDAPPREEGRRPFVMPNPLFDAIDTNSDGVITADELAKASESLKKLDKDSDGKITREEARPEFPRGGNFGGRGGEGGGFGRGGRGPGGPGAPGGSGGPGGEGFTVEGFVARYMERDANKDGKLDATELGERGARLLQNNDKNSDGFIDRDELKAAAEALREQFNNRGGNRPARPSSDNNT